MKLLSVILLLCFALTGLRADALVTVKGKGRRSSIKLETRSGANAKVKKNKAATEIALRCKKGAATVKLTFKVTADDEFTFSLGAANLRSGNGKKTSAAKEECILFRVNDKELIGPKAGKEGKQSEALARSKPFKETFKLKKNSKLVLEFTVQPVSKTAKGKKPQQTEEQEPAAAEQNAEPEKKGTAKRANKKAGAEKKSSAPKKAAEPENDDPENSDGQ